MALKLSDEARYLRMYRARPSLWYAHKFDARTFPLARYRARAAVEAHLERSPYEHRWAKDRLKAGRLVLDDTRSYQAEALDEIARPIREGRREFVHRVALKWANGVAKTATAALAVHWFMDCFPGGKVASTAGTWSQLREQLWREIATWTSRSYGEIITATVPVLKTQINVAPDWAAIGRAAKSEATFEGIHAPAVLLIFDEAKAIKPEIWQAARRILRGRGMLFFVVLSSPGSPSGVFYDVCAGDQSAAWSVLSVSAYESERVSLEQVDTDISELSESSPLFVSMDLGEFPDEGEQTVIPLSWAQAAIDRPVAGWAPEKAMDPEAAEWRTAGVDVARRGADETAFVELLGRRAQVVGAWVGQRTTYTAGRVHDRWAQVDYERIGIDDTGVGGGVCDELVELPVDEINFGAQARKAPERYVNLKSELYFHLRAEFEAGFQSPENENVGLSIPNDRKLIHQLTCQEFAYDERQRRKVEGHKDLLARGEKSPDRADALALANYVRTGAGQSRLEALPDVL